MRRPPFLLLACSVSACASAGPSSSYVSGIGSDRDATRLATAAAEIAARKLPSSAAVTLDPVPASQANNVLTPALRKALESRGFIVTDKSSHFLRYWAAPLDGGDLLRLSLDGVEASRFFIRSDEGLEPGGPFTIRQADAR
jgi:hypothetical protein